MNVETLFRVPKMDCPSEERLIRMAVEGVDAVKGLAFDLDKREVLVTHSGDAGAVLERLHPLGLGATIESSQPAATTRQATTDDPDAERRVLRTLLAINAAMFVAELGVGFTAQSTGLIADSLDMLADAMIYGLSLAAVGRAVTKQRQAARLSGWVQMLFAIAVLAEVGRRAAFGSEPVEALMIGVASLALVANLTCVALLARHRKGGVHLRASWIFSTNDALANLGVIVAGVLVLLTGSAIPDLVIGAIISLVVFSGAIRILRLGRPNAED
jgi:Co/Zn/Cd efflux system component